MPAITQSNAIPKGVACYLCVGLSLAQATKISFMAEIAKTLDPDYETDVNSLLVEGSCFVCNGMSDAETMELVLLKKISDALKDGNQN